MYTDSDAEPVQQPAFAAANGAVKLNPAAESVNQPRVISDSDSNVELLL